MAASGLKHFIALSIVAMAMAVGGIRALLAQSPLQYVPLPTPCRAVDTRATGGPIAAGTSQNFSISQAGNCSIRIGLGIDRRTLGKVPVPSGH